jgi:predicted dehydrogenase/MoaA/NifB/PqqE/SkfB family radical SAM enzyme
MAQMTQVSLGGRCARTCTVCDCHDAPSPTDREGIPLALKTGSGRLEFRGDAPAVPTFGKVLDAVSRARFTEVYVRTHGATLVTPEAASALRDRGVDGVIIPLFAHVSAVHDRIAAAPDALVTALRAMRTCSAAGLAVAVEIPLLAPRLQNPSEIIALAHRAVPTLGAARFYLPVRPQPPVLAPPSWTDARAPLAAAIERCHALNVSVALHEFDAVPLCALGHDEAHQRLYKLNPRRPVTARDGFVHAAVCGECAVKTHCLGPSDAYRAAHDGAGLLPFTSRPERLFDQRTTPRREWNETHREAASQVINRVLRPTVHCNQDCPFCSANETTENVFRDAGEMLRRIARLARAGVRYISFSGGEPTLSKDLVHYIAAASRLGIRDIELVTNGVLIDAPEKVKPLRDAGLTKAFVSLHAHDELLGRRTTSKVGDWERSVRAVDALVNAGVRVDLNHVISSINYAYLPRFAEFMTARWRGEVGVSFAFITPQFKALENLWLVPKISDVIPYLRRAMQTLVARRNRFIVGSRQGVPPCFLGEYVAWSDFVEMSPQAHADDEPQKIRGPACDQCRFSPQCVGLWKPYAARYGFSELVPVEGAPLTREEAETIALVRPPLDFAEVHPALRATPREETGELAIPDPPREPRRLPVVRAQPSRTLRVALLGSGPQAQRLARAIPQIEGLTLVGVASPHLPDRDPGPFAGLTLDRDPEALFERVKPDVVIVASATLAHASEVERAVARGLPVLVEKPLARTLDEASAVVSLGERGMVMPAHAMRFTPGVVAMRSALGDFGRVLRVSYTKRATPTSPEAPATWSREGLYQIFLHALDLVGSITGTVVGTLTRVEARGDHRPALVRVELSYPGGVTGEVTLDFTANAVTDELAVAGERGRRLAWRRDASGEVLEHDSPSGDRTTSVERGSDTARMLEAFRDAVITKGPSPVATCDGRDAMAVAQRVVEALKDHLVRPTAPRHVASPAMKGS